MVFITPCALLVLPLYQVNLLERSDEPCHPAPLPQRRVSVTLSFLHLLLNFLADLSAVSVPRTPEQAALLAFAI